MVNTWGTVPHVCCSAGAKVIGRVKNAEEFANYWSRNNIETM